LDVVAADLLKARDVPGGVEVISGCSAIPLRVFEVGSMPTEGALNILSQSEHSLTWDKKGPAYTVTIRGTATPSVSSAKLPSLQLRVKTLSEATDILLQQRAMQDHLAALNTTEAPDNIGFSSIHERELRIVSLPPGTLREDLNALASAFGAAVWKLDQHDCGGNRTFRLSWIAK
jgi:hypothetical protein